MPKKQMEVTKQVNKHQLTGLDLVDLSESNLLEMGIYTIHDRKSIIRQIKSLKNDSNSSYGIVQVVYKDSTNQLQNTVRLKITESKVKVKHVIAQSYQTLKQKECDLTQYCLTSSNYSGQNVILSNNTLIVDLFKPGFANEFFLCKSKDFIDSTTRPFSINSPIRILKPNIESSLERLINSPENNIYVQPVDDEIVHLKSTDSQTKNHLFSQKQNKRNSSKSSQKTNQPSGFKIQSKQKNQQQVNMDQASNREHQFNQSNNSNYLQNYITSNRQSHKKQQSNVSSQLTHPNQFQKKKHSVNDTASTYGSSTVNTNPQMFQSTCPSNIIQASNTSNLNSLSRGNSMKKMRTFCNGSNGVSQPSNLNSGNKRGILSNQPSINSLNKQNKKSSQKGKNMNMYSTMNANHSKRQSIHREIKGSKNPVYQGIQNEEQVKIVDLKLMESQKIQSTPGQCRQNNNEHLILSHKSIVSGRKKIGKKESQVIQYQDQINVNNLNEIFSDFLDEQKQYQPDDGSQSKIMSKVRAESLHSRQQILLEEDSLENTKKNFQKYQIYNQTEQIPNQIQDSVSLNQLITQRAVKHMAHKSMYALNSSQIKNGHYKKSSVCNNTQSKNNIAQHYGTFDSSETGIQFQYAATTMSECGNLDQMLLNENYNTSNMNYNKNQNINHRIQTEIDDADKENTLSKTSMVDTQERRGGTIAPEQSIR